MSNSPIPEITMVKPLTARRWLMACLAVSVLIPSIGHAQLTTTALPTTLMAIESGLHWVGDGSVSIATVSDGRRSTALASVTDGVPRSHRPARGGHNGTARTREARAIAVSEPGR